MSACEERCVFFSSVLHRVYYALVPAGLCAIGEHFYGRHEYMPGMYTVNHP